MALPRLPDPDELALFLHTAEGQHGPFSRRTLADRLAAGGVDEAHLWMEGMADWETLAEHREVLVAGLDAPAPAPSNESEDDRNDRLFGELVKSSWNYLSEHRFAQHVDEVFLGAVITATLDTGYSLIDLSSDGTHHFLRFENLQDRSRTMFRLTHLTNNLATAKVLGQRASAIIGYGERVSNITKVWSAIKAEMKSSYIRDPEPGTITVDGDLNSGYVYCQVDLFLDIEEYVGRDYTIRYDQLAAHVGATTHALRKYLRGRFA